MISLACASLCGALISTFVSGKRGETLRGVFYLTLISSLLGVVLYEIWARL